MYIDLLLTNQEVVNSDVYKGWLDSAKEYNYKYCDLDSHLCLARRAANGIGDSDEFLEEELVMASILGAVVASKYPEVSSYLIPALQDEVSAGRGLADAVSKSQQILRDSFTSDTTIKIDVKALGGADRINQILGADVVSKNGTMNVEKAVRSIVDKTITKGSAAVASSTILDNLPRKERILEGMVRSSKYYTNEYFNTQVVPKLYKNVDKVISGASEAAEAGFKSIREGLEKQMTDTPYFKVVSNSATSRSYHYGVVKAGELSGYRAYKYVAILDSRTSDICIELAGKEFWLADAVGLVEKSMMAEGDEIKSVSPWSTVDSVKGKSNRELLEASEILPPRHGNCRSTIRLLEE